MISDLGSCVSTLSSSSMESLSTSVTTNTAEGERLSWSEEKIWKVSSKLEFAGELQNVHYMNRFIAGSVPTIRRHVSSLCKGGKRSPSKSGNSDCFSGQLDRTHFGILRKDERIWMMNVSIDATKRRFMGCCP